MSYTGYIYAASLLAGCLLVWLVGRNRPEFTIADLLTGDNNRISLRKFSALVALFSSTWAFVTLVEQGKLTEWFFTAYIGVWAVQKVASDITAAVQAPKP